MNRNAGVLGALMVAVSLSTVLHAQQSAPSPAGPKSPCAADSSFQSLAFWVGDWDVYDSTGAKYATQRVRAVLDECAITAEWTSGGGNKGMGVSAFDRKTRAWKQIYVSNQVPFLSGVDVRTSDPSYTGPGIRFLQILDSAGRNLVQTRITIMPLSGHRALQDFKSRVTVAKHGRWFSRESIACEAMPSPRFPLSPDSLSRSPSHLTQTQSSINARSRGPAATALPARAPS